MANETGTTEMEAGVGERFSEEEAEGVSEKLVQLVIFQLGEEEYGVDIHKVKEILRMVEITAVPEAPPFIEGIINVRGQIVMVINLEERFLIEREEPIPSKHILIAEVEGNLFGLKVDEVTEVFRLPEESIKGAPSIIASKIRANYLKGVGIVDERLIILLDLDRILSEKELAELMKAKREYRRVIKAKEEKVEEEKPKEREKKRLEEKVLKKVEERLNEKEVKVEEGEEKVEEKPEEPSEPEEKVGGEEK